MRACLGCGCFLSMIGVGCGPTSTPAVFQGYIEADYVYAAAPVSGALQSLAVERGQKVQADTVLFELDPEPEASALKELESRRSEAASRLDDLQKGKRPTELAALDARLEQARASLERATREYARVKQLHADGVAPVDDLDRSRTERDRFQAQVEEMQAELETAQLGGRPDAVDAARAELEAARAATIRAAWSVSQKKQSAPEDAVVHDTLYRPGEWVAAGKPVVILLPPANLKVRFFIPQAVLPQAQPGGPIRVILDGEPAPIPAQIRYVSTEAEFTPPVIYSRQTRAKLVFMVEARFETNAVSRLRPGQPVDVILGETGP